MDWLAQLFVFHGKFLGVDWHFWKVVGWTGNAIFSSRFLVQWWATEKHKRVVVPAAFWWLSLVGSGCLLAYGISKRDSVFILAYAFTWIPYIRNLVIARRAHRAQQDCGQCGSVAPPLAPFCPACGARLRPVGAARQAGATS